MTLHMQPFYAALQDIIRADEPEYQCSSMARASVSKTEDQGSIPCSGATRTVTRGTTPVCRWCGQPGGDNCSWCEPCDMPDEDPDEE